MKPSLLLIIFILCAYSFSQAQLSCPAGSVIGAVSSFTKTPNGNICAGTNVAFTGQTTGNSYSWDFGVNAGSTSTAQSPNYTFPYSATNQTYTVYYRVMENGTGTNPDTCHLSSKTVTVNAKRQIIVTDPLSYFVPCAANANIQDTTVTFTITNPFPSVNYSWDFGDGTTIASSPNASQTHHYSGFGTYPLRVWEVGFSCPGFSQPFKFYTEPVASPLLPGNPPIASYCEGTPVTILNQSVVGNASSYSWDWGDGTTYNVYDETAQTHSYNYGNINFCGGGLPVNYTGGVFVYQVKLIATNSCAPYNHQATLQVNITPKPHAEFTLPSSACVNDLITFTNATCPSCGPGITNTYSWNFGVNPNTWVVNNCATPNSSFTYTAAGVYNVTLIVKRNSTACGSISDTVVHPITITAPPILNVTSSIAPTSGCAPLTVTFTNTTMPLVGVNYNWTVSPNSGYSFVVPTTSTTKNATITFTVAGTYTITMTAQNVCGTQTYTQVITVRDKPSITNYTHQNPVCLTATSNTFSFCPAPNFLANNGTISAYSWSLDNTPISTTSSIPCQNLAAGTHTLYISCTNQCGTTILKDTIIVKPFPNAIVTPNGAFAPNYVGCIGSSGVFDVNFVNTSTNINANGHLWSWSPAIGVSTFGGTSTTTANLSLHFSTFGDYTINYSGANSCGTDTLQYHIHIKKAPSIMISTFPTTACGSLTTTPLSSILDNNGIITAHSWIFSGGTPPNANTQISPSVTFGVGTHNIIGTATNVCGTSSDTTSVTVTAPIIPVANIQTASACQNGAAITFQATPAGGTWSGTNVTNLAGGNGSFNPISVGSNIYAIYTLGTGACMKKDTVVIQVFAPPIVNAGNDTTVCQSNSPINLTNMGTGCVWKNAAGTTITSFTPSLAGSFTLTLSCTNSNNCSASDSKIFTVNPRPTVNIPDTVVYCAGNVAVALPSASPNSVVWTSPFVSGNNFNTIASGVGIFPVNYCVSNTFNCQVCSTLIVKVISPSNINAGANFSLCRNAPCVSLSPNPSGGTWTTNVSGTQFCPLTKPTGANLLIYSFGTGTCTVKDTVIATVVDTPSVSLVVSPANVCQNGGIVTLSGANPTGGTFSGTGVIANNQFNPIGFSNSTSTNVPLLYTYTNTTTTCTSKKSGTITVNPVPIITIPDSVVYCGGNLSVTLPAATPIGGNWISTFVTGNNFNTVASGTGFFPVVYNYNNNFGCNKKDTLIVHVISPSNINAGSNFSICRNAPCVSLSPNPSGGTWSANVSGNQFCPLTKPTGVNLLIYTFGTGTCTVKDTVIATVVDTPSVSLTVSPANVCQNGGIVTLSGGNPTGGIFSGTGVMVNNQFNPSGFSSSVSTTVPLLYTYTNTTTTCTSKKSGIITVNPVPVIVIQDTVVYCGGNLSVTLPAATPMGGNWLSPFVTGNNFNTVASGTGFFPVVYNYNNSFGCNKKDTLIVHVISPTNINAGANFSICRNAPCVSLSPNPSGGTWSANVSANQFCPLTKPTGANLLIYTFGTGTCTVKDTIIAMVVDTPSISLLVPLATVCQNGGIVTLSGANPTGGTFSGTGVFGNNQFDPSGFSSSVSTTVPLLYTYTNTTTTCTSKKSTSIIVNPVPVIVIPDTVVYCGGNLSVTLPTASPTGGNWISTFVTGNNFNTIASGTGFFPVVYSYNNTFGCNKKDTLIVHIISAATVSAGSDFSICRNANCVNLQGNPLLGTWTPAATFCPLNAPTGINQFVYSYGSGTCLVHDTLNITVNDTPLVSLNLIPKDICENAGLLQLSGNTPTGGIWSGMGVNSLGVLNPLLISGTSAVFYTFTDANTCHSIKKDSIHEHLLPIPNFSVAAMGCKNASIPFLNVSQANANYSWTFGDGNTSNSVNPTNIYANIGTYNITLVATENSPAQCKDSVSHSIEIIEPPIADFSAVPDSACATLLASGISGISVQFTNNSYGVNNSYSWTFGNFANSILANPPAIDFAEGLEDTLYMVNLVATNMCGSNQKADSIKVIPLPKVSFGALVSSGCSPYIPTFFPVYHGSPTAYSWVIVQPTGNIVFDTSPFPASFAFIAGAQDSNYTIRVYVTNVCGIDSAETTLLVHPNTITAAFNIPYTSGCAPLSLPITNLSNAPNIVYNFGDNSATGTGSPVHVYQNAGTYILAQYADNGCSRDTLKQTIVVNAAPVVSFNVTTPLLCEDSPCQFQTNLANVSAYSWNFGDNTTISDTSNAFNPAYNYPNAGNYSVNLTVISSLNNCKSSISQNVTIQAAPNLNIQVSDTTICQGLPIQFSDAGNGNFHSWNFGDGNVATTANSTHIYNAQGNFNVYYLATNTIGCVKDTNLLVIVREKPVSQFISSNDEMCGTPSNIVFTNQSVGTNLGYAWTFGNGNSSTNTNTSQTYAQTGDYTVQLIAVTAFNCKDTSAKIIHIYPQPIAKDSIIPPFGCNPLTINVVNQSINGTIYSWNFGEDNTWAIGNQAPSHTYNVPDSTYILTLIANYNDKCFDSVKQSIQVARSPVANFQVKLVGDTCGGIAHPQIVNLSQFANHYSWSLGANQYSYDSIPTANYSIPDTYLIVLVASNNFNCKDTFTQSVTLHPQVNALFAADSTRGCNPFAVQFHSQSLNATTFEWDFHDGETSINENPLHIFANSGKYDVTLIASDNGLCKDTLTFYQYIEVLQSPIADFVSVPVEGNPDDGSVKLYNNTVFGNTYSWDLGDGNFANERDSVLHRYYENDTFRVTLYAQNLIGCRDTITHYVFPYLFGGLQIPNAFMPNSPVDGTEFFLPVGVGLIDYHIAIYDKWGGVIWESTLLKNGKPVEKWDGKDKKGLPVMSGAYLWRVHKATFEDRREWKGMIYEQDGVPTRVGTVTVIR